MTFKYTAVIFALFMLSACSTNPPKPPMPKGEWVQMNTNVPAAKLQLQKIKATKGGAE